MVARTFWSKLKEIDGGDAMAWELMMKSVSRETDEASSIIQNERKKAPQSISLRDTLVEQLSSAHWEGQHDCG